MRNRSYSELMRLHTFEERFDYLNLHGKVGDTTFGFDRYLNQMFYTSAQWKSMRHFVLARDNGCDMGMDGYELHYRPVIHHMNPMFVTQLVDGDDVVLDPEYLVTVSHRTHNAIHFGQKSLLFTPIIVRKRDDTKLW